MGAGPEKDKRPHSIHSKGALSREAHHQARKPQTHKHSLFFPLLNPSIPTSTAGWRGTQRRRRRQRPPRKKRMDGRGRAPGRATPAARNPKTRLGGVERLVRRGRRCGKVPFPFNPPKPTKARGDGPEEPHPKAKATGKTRGKIESGEGGEGRGEVPAKARGRKKGGGSQQTPAGQARLAHAGG